MSAEEMNLGAVNRRGEIPLVKTIWRFENPQEGLPPCRQDTSRCSSRSASLMKEAA